MLRDPDKRKRLVLKIAIGVLIFTVLWLIGGICQWRANYAEWLSSGAFSGEAELKGINWNPFVCIWSVFAKGGFLLVLLVLIFAACGYGWVRIHDRFESKEIDIRGFAYSPTGSYGTARFMGQEEMREAFLVQPISRANGVILCKKGNDAVQLPRVSGENMNVLIFGPPGSMKSRAIIRPAIFSSLLAGESVIVTDTKGELYADTCDLARKCGHKVRVLNFVQPRYSDGWNSMDAILASRGTDDFDIQVNTYVQVVLSNTSNGKKEEIFYLNGYTSLLKALILYVVLDPNRKDADRNLPAAYRLLTDHSMAELEALFKHLERNHPARISWHFFSNSTEGVQASFLTGLGNRLQILQSQAISNIISRSDINLEDPAREPCIFYCIIPDRDNSMEFLSSLFFSFLLIQLSAYADRHGRKCPVPVNLILDEFCNVGTLGATEESFGKALSSIRSRDIRCMLSVQSLGQFQNRYDNNVWSEIIGCCDTQVMLGCNDDITAEYWSGRAGVCTIQVQSKRIQKHTISPFQIIPQYAENIGDGQRNLVTPDEATRLDKALKIKRGMLVYRNNCNILLGTKLDFTLLPISKQIAQYDIEDYKPVRFKSRKESEADEAAWAEAAEAFEQERRMWESAGDTEYSSAPLTLTERIKLRGDQLKVNFREIQFGVREAYFNLWHRRKQAEPEPEEDVSEPPDDMTGTTFYGAGRRLDAEEDFMPELPVDMPESEVGPAEDTEPVVEFDYSDLPAPESHSERGPHTRMYSTGARPGAPYGEPVGGDSEPVRTTAETEKREAPATPASRPKRTARKKQPPPKSGTYYTMTGRGQTPSAQPPLTEDDDDLPLWDNDFTAQAAQQAEKQEGDNSKGRRGRKKARPPEIEDQTSFDELDSFLQK